MSAETPHVRVRTWALVVGIDRYGGGALGDLPFAASGARRLAAALVTQDGVGLPADRVLCLTGDDGRVVRQELMRDLAALVEAAGPNDQVFVYFAGHGRDLGDDFALCTSPESTGGAPTEVTGSEVGSALERCRARGILLVLDCCQGAAFAERAPTVFRRLPRDGHRILLSSCAADESSWELPALRGTAFTNALACVCEGALPVGDPPGAIYFSQLLATLQTEVDSASSNSGDGRHHQTVQFAGV